MKVNLAVLLAERGVSITDVAENTGLSRTTLTQLTQNTGKGVQFETIDKICNYLNITPNDLLIVTRDVEQLSFGNKIKNLRLKRGWTQEQFSDKLGVSAQVISNYERDYRQPEFETLVDIAKLFKVTTDYLLGYEVEK